MKSRSEARRALLSLTMAGALAVLAALGGSWGEVAGQTAGPPPAGDAPVPEVVPPPALEYRPVPTAAGPVPPNQAAATPTSQRPATPPPGQSPAMARRPTSAVVPSGTPPAAPQPSPTSATPAGALPALTSPLATSAGRAVAGGTAVLVALALGAWQYWRRRP